MPAGLFLTGVITMHYICSMPNSGEKGPIKEFFSDDPAKIEEWAADEDRPGRAVYYCASRLKPGARRRNLQTVGTISRLHVDIDPADIVEPMADVEKLLELLDLPPSEVRNSGRGRHIFFDLDEPIDADDAEMALRANKVLKRLTHYLCGDRAVAHFAALLRCRGTHNTKGGGLSECKTVFATGCIYSLGEMEAWLDRVEGQSPFTRANGANYNGHTVDTNNTGEQTITLGGPLNPYALLDAMRFQGEGGAPPINNSQARAVASLLRRGMSVDMIVEEVLDATVRAVGGAGATWDWTQEERQIRDMAFRFISSNLELAHLLPDAMASKFKELDEAGRKPSLSKNIHGWYVRTGVNAKEEPKDEPKDGAAAEKPKKPKVLVLRPWVIRDPARHPPRVFLYSKHYQRRTVSVTAGPGGMGKSSLGLVEGVAMATCRNLLGEQPAEKLRVWYHNGEDPLDEIDRRVFAICQHYGIPQAELLPGLWVTSGNEFPLRVAKGYANLEIDDALVRQISAAIRDNEIDVAIFDPLVTLHSVSEADPGKMDAVVRVFGGIADEHDAGIDLSHHVRKPLPGGGGADYDIHDIRGVQAITDACRAARILNRMNERDAEAAGVSDLERISRFRVDRAKGNYSRAEDASWRQFISVELPNGDDVGVVAPWSFTGQGPPSPEKLARDQADDQLFLDLLDRFTREGRRVGVSGPGSAAKAFSGEPEAKAAKVNKGRMANAMQRLFKDKRIINEEYKRNGQTSSRLARAGQKI